MRTPRADARLARGAALVAVVLAVAGVLLVAGWWSSRPAAGFGAPLPAVPAASPVPVPTPVTSPVPTGPAAVGRRDAAPSAPAPTPVPVRLEIPDLGVDAPVVPVGVDADGALAVPEDPQQVGWYRWGSVPGEAGATVLAGHVDTHADGPGALIDLASLEAGTTVRVTSSDGGVAEFRVASRHSYLKADLPAEEVFARTGDPRLELITCGGDFDRSTRSYAENVVVTAL